MRIHSESHGYCSMVVLRVKICSQLPENSNFPPLLNFLSLDVDDSLGGTNQSISMQLPMLNYSQDIDVIPTSRYLNNSLSFQHRVDIDCKINDQPGEHGKKAWRMSGVILMCRIKVEYTRTQNAEKQPVPSYFNIYIVVTDQITICKWE